MSTSVVFQFPISITHQIILSIFIAIISGCNNSDHSSPIGTKAELGELLFNDVNLSLNRSQSCATCHNPDHAFTDDRTLDAYHPTQIAAASLGDDGVSIGDRNSPMASYAAFSFDFKFGTRERVATQSADIADYVGYLGGQFWDGRAVDLAEQAGGPPLNPGEMNMPDKAAVIARIQENSEYIEAFETLFNNNIFDDINATYEAMTQSIKAFEFETADVFYPFDSKYDRSLSGEYQYNPNSKAALGKSLFFGSDLTCAACHQSFELGKANERFTGFEYHNIGVPENTDLRAVSGVSSTDLGLALNPVVIENGDAQVSKGKFKTPSLRNVAISAPYMHNGKFNELETVLKFYEHVKLRALDAVDTTLNPETNQAWSEPEVDDNIAHDLLGKNDINLTPQRIEAIVCFLMTLTDAQYENLLPPTKVSSCGI